MTFGLTYKEFAEVQHVSRVFY